jgi:hypothetical protein
MRTDVCLPTPPLLLTLMPGCVRSASATSV